LPCKCRCDDFSIIFVFPVNGRHLKVMIEQFPLAEDLDAGCPSPSFSPWGEVSKCG
jgi:hypothetical protein